MAQLLGTARPDLFELKGAVGNIVYGFRGDDDFFDSVGNDWVFGGAGNDQFYSAAGGSDVMFGGVGDDEFHLSHGKANIMIRGGNGFDTLVLAEGVLADGEKDYLQYAVDGVMLQLADGGVLDINGVEHVMFV